MLGTHRQQRPALFNNPPLRITQILVEVFNDEHDTTVYRTISHRDQSKRISDG